MSYGGELSGKRRRSPYLRSSQLEKMAKELLDDAGGEMGTTGGREPGPSSGRPLGYNGRRPVSRQDNERKPLDANRYATKKTIAQGMLDVALLTANASQLRYVLQVGEQHEFYTLMVTLISVSIILQILIGVLLMVLGALDITDESPTQMAADIINDITVIMVFIVTLLNVIIASFGIETTQRLFVTVTPAPAA
ncbi:ninjurin-2-like isoform X1 [Pollicipes pollicipes]|uniref:ninjurin-2-like isoform X1 n=1 Tax=Pollicipes pollicipes TaxID=41117 RepID=UPI001884F162|nr:ninjurin-2-like isoform X1 [Pollicipes pollicipes]